MSSTAAVVCMTSSTRTMERVFVASARSEASKGVLIGRQAATDDASHLCLPQSAPLRTCCNSLEGGKADLRKSIDYLLQWLRMYW